MNKCKVACVHKVHLFVLFLSRLNRHWCCLYSLNPQQLYANTSESNRSALEINDKVTFMRKAVTMWHNLKKFLLDYLHSVPRGRDSFCPLCYFNRIKISQTSSMVVNLRIIKRMERCWVPCVTLAIVHLAPKLVWKSDDNHGKTITLFMFCLKIVNMNLWICLWFKIGVPRGNGSYIDSDQLRTDEWVSCLLWHIRTTENRRRRPPRSRKAHGSRRTSQRERDMPRAPLLRVS